MSLFNIFKKKKTQEALKEIERDFVSELRETYYFKNDNYDSLIVDMKIAKARNEEIVNEMCKKAESFEKSMKKNKKK